MVYTHLRNFSIILLYFFSVSATKKDLMRRNSITFTQNDLKFSPYSRGKALQRGVDYCILIAGTS